jgi:hypothetical protein
MKLGRPNRGRELGGRHSRGFVGDVFDETRSVPAPLGRCGSYVTGGAVGDEPELGQHELPYRAVGIAAGRTRFGGIEHTAALKSFAYPDRSDSSAGRSPGRAADAARTTHDDEDAGRINGWSPAITRDDRTTGATLFPLMPDRRSSMSKYVAGEDSTLRRLAIFDLAVFGSEAQKAAKTTPLSTAHRRCGQPAVSVAAPPGGNTW